MSSILYYSNYCNNFKNFLTIISKSSVKNNLHFICVDKRIQRNNKTYNFENNQEIFTQILLRFKFIITNNNYTVICGDEILNHLKPVEEVKTKATNYNGEPCVLFNNSLNSNIMSDNYSFDQLVMIYLQMMEEERVYNYNN